MDALAWFRPCLATLPSGRRWYYVPPPFVNGTELSIHLYVETFVSELEELKSISTAVAEGRQTQLELSIPELDAAGCFKRASVGGGGLSEKVEVQYELQTALAEIDVAINVRDTDGDRFSVTLRLDRIEPRCA